MIIRQICITLDIQRDNDHDDPMIDVLSLFLYYKIINFYKI